jgi:hypothetical protein
MEPLVAGENKRYEVSVFGGRKQERYKDKQKEQIHLSAS